jgi:hypothetical protein
MNRPNVTSVGLFVFLNLIMNHCPFVLAAVDSEAWYMSVFIPQTPAMQSMLIVEDYELVHLFINPLPRAF